jgi:hypothetical protein
MACLSVFPPDGRLAVVVANPIYLVGFEELLEGASLSFEVLDVDASSLKSMIGETQFFVLHSQAFWGTIRSLERSAEPLLGKPALSGILIVHNLASQNEQSSQS